MVERNSRHASRKRLLLTRGRLSFYGFGVLLLGLGVIKCVLSGLFLEMGPPSLSGGSVALADSSAPDPASAVSMEESFDKGSRELREKELELQRREQKLLPLRAEIEEKLAELNELQLRLTAYAKTLADRERALEDQKMGHLVSLYSAMEPAKAAAIMDKLKVGTVVLILRHMKGKSAGQILAMMNPERGAVISEKLTQGD